MNNNVSPWDMINGAERSTSEQADKRLKICKSCPELIKLTTQCKKCGCFMTFKTKLQMATCPLEKW